ncbi:MAG TPA: glycosyltransferase family 39 protein [Tepidisphaeraceae bacterium]|jgi:hypothetical protein
MALLAGIIMLARAGAGIGVFTHTYDEPYHVGAAVGLWEAGRATEGIQHPPLVRLLVGAVLKASGISIPAERQGIIHNDLRAYDLGEEVLFRGPVPYWQVLVRCRAVMLLFAAAAMVYAWLLGKWLAGEQAAALSVVFFSIDPSFLAHSMLVTTDVAACAGFLAGIYHGFRWIARRSYRRASCAGAAIGLAIACKFSCIALIPALLAAWAIRSVVRRITNRNSLLPTSPPHQSTVKQLLVIILAAFIALWASYLFDVGPISQQDHFTIQPEWARVPDFVKNTPIPMPSLLLGLFVLYGHNAHGHLAYLNGATSRHGHWYFFPETLAIKSPLAMLLAFALALMLLIVVRRKALPSLMLLAVIGVFLFGSMTSSLNMGIRHVLPIVPVICLFAVTQLITLRPFRSGARDSRRGSFALVPALLIVMSLVETIWIHPDYLAFFNFLAGGPRQGERFLVDANLDWGQDIGRLAAELHSPEIRGRDYTIRVFDSSTEALLGMLGLDPASTMRPPAGLFAISKSVKHGLKLDNYDWLHEYPLLKHVGYSIDIYDLSSATTKPSARQQEQPEPERR